MVTEPNAHEPATSQSEPNGDRRAHPRFAYSVPVWVLPRDYGTPLLDCTPLPGCCQDLSRSGLLLRTIQPIESAQVHVRFDTPAGIYVTESSQVVWERRVSDSIWEYGIKFDIPLPADLLAPLASLTVEVGSATK